MQLKKKTFFVVCLVAAMFATLGTGLAAYADSSGQVPLAVLPELRGVQGQNKKANYFDLKVNPGMKQQLKVRLINQSRNQPVNVNLAINPATTSSAPTIAYNHPTYSKNSINQYLSFAHGNGGNVTIQPNKQRVVTMNLQTPKTPAFDSFHGTILGGLTITQNGKSQKASLNSLYSYAVAVQLKKGKPPLANVKLKQLKVLPMGQRYLLKAVLVNGRPAVLGKTKIETSVTSVSSGEVVAKNTTEHAQIAPSSQFSYFVPQPAGGLNNGKYLLSMKLISHDPQFNGKKVWNFNRKFSINNSTGNTNVRKKSARKIAWWLFLPILIVILMISIIYRFKLKKYEGPK